MHSVPFFTASPTPSPTRPLHVPYASPTSPTNTQRFSTFLQAAHSHDRLCECPPKRTSHCLLAFLIKCIQVAFNFKTALRVSFLMRSCVSLRERRLVVHGAHHGGASMLAPAIPGDRACETKPHGPLLATCPGMPIRKRSPTRQTRGVVPLRRADTHRDRDTRSDVSS